MRLPDTAQQMGRTRTTRLRLVAFVGATVMLLGACGSPSPALGPSPAPSLNASPSESPAPSLTASPSDNPAPSAQYVMIEFVLTVNGRATAGDTLQYYFDPGGFGQTLFTLCGAPGPVCVGGGQVLRRHDSVPSSTVMAPYRFERVDSAGTPFVFASGTVSLRANQTVAAAYSYG